MSKFSAINLSDDEADLEEHTRELQIEESLKLFKKALNFQKEQDFEQAFAAYDELFKIDVISDFSPFTATVSNLRYLSYRNRGFLKFDKMIKDQELKNKAVPKMGSGEDADDGAETDEDLDDLYEDAMSCVEDLITALMFGDGDTKLVELIYQFFSYFDNDRLTRLIIEFELMKNDLSIGTESNLLILRRNKISSTFQKFLHRYKHLLTKLNDFDSVASSKDSFLNKNHITIDDTNFQDTNAWDLSFLKPLKDEILSNQFNNLFQPKQVEIDLSEYSKDQLTLSTILKEVQSVLPKPKSRLKRFYDHYYSTDDPVEIVSLKINDSTDSVYAEREDTTEQDAATTEEAAENVESDSDVMLVDDFVNEEKDAEPKSVIQEEDQDTAQTDKNDLPADKTTSETDNEKERIRSSRRLNVNIPELESVKVTDLDWSYQKQFITSLNSYLDTLNTLQNTKFRVEDLCALICNENTAPQNVIHTDFLEILDGWNKQKSDLFLLNADSTKKNISMMEILNASTSTDFAPVEPEDIDSYDITPLISVVNDSKLHYHQLRIAILEFVLQPHDNKYLITDYKFDDQTFQDLKHFIDCSDILLYNKIKDSLDDRANIAISLAIFEILVDTYVSIHRELEANKNQDKHRAASTELMIQKRIMIVRIERWKSLTEDCLFTHKDLDSNLFLRFEWCECTYLQHQTDLTSLQESQIERRLADLLKHKSLANTSIFYANYHSINALSYGNVNVQLSKLNILTTFSNMFQEDSNIDDPEKIKLLEDILFPQTQVEKTKEQKDMEIFVTTSSLDLKLKLYQALLDYYRKTSSFEKYQKCIEQLINLLYSRIASEEYLSKTVNARQQELLCIYAYWGEYANHYTATLSINNWKLTRTDEAQETFKQILAFFSLDYLFCLHEDVAYYSSVKSSIRTKSSRSYNKMKDAVVNSFSLVFVYFNSFLASPDSVQVTELLDLCHDQLGSRRFCEAADGKFLKLSEDTLVHIGSSKSEKYILQLISCRYRLQITVDGFAPIDHETKGIPFDKANALEIAKYVLPICFKKRNPIVSNIKSDIKILLDSIYEAIGDLDEESPFVKRSSGILENYLDNTVIDLRLMRDAFYGLFSLNLVKSKFDIQRAIDDGLYYLQGVSALNGFKIRKKSMQSRIAELDVVLKMLKADIICGANRLESWFLLGQAYGYLVEDDLIWTSDKLTNEDKKESTALIQKKSILCYLMAVNQYAQIEDKSSIKDAGAMLWSSFSKELYNACMEPMSMLCFKANRLPNYSKANGKIVEKKATNKLSDRKMLTLLTSSFQMASKLDSADWINYYYLAKLAHKTTNSPTKVFGYLLESCKLAKNAGVHSETIIEPHYLLCSLVFKMLMKDIITIDEASKFIQEDAILKAKIDETTIASKEAFCSTLIDCLKHICSLDKKNWHHKPHYRIARIQSSVFHDCKTAKQEILTLVNLKPNVKNLITIWKPEYERPGKHFIYNYQYVMFAIDLMTEDKDLSSLILLGKKLRRFGASMVNLLKAWAHATKNICDLTRRYANIDPHYSEFCMSTIIYGEFMQKAKEFNSYMNNRHGMFEDEKHQELFYLFTDVAEIKRMSNGFSQTAYIDDTFYCLYLKLYSIYKDEIDNTSQPILIDETTKSRVAKRDIAEVIKSLQLPKLPEKQINFEIPDPPVKPEADKEKAPTAEPQPVSQNSNPVDLLNPDSVTGTPGGTMPSSSMQALDSDNKLDSLENPVRPIVEEKIEEAKETKPKIESVNQTELKVETATSANIEVISLDDSDEETESSQQGLSGLKSSVSDLSKKSQEDANSIEPVTALSSPIRKRSRSNSFATPSPKKAKSGYEVIELTDAEDGDTSDVFVTPKKAFED